MAVLAHEALLYEGLDQFVAGTTTFIAEGLDAGELMLVAVPEPRLTALRDALGDTGRQVDFLDMGRLGGNPARIIPAVQALMDAHPGRGVRWIGEPVWLGRRSCERVEGERHEALLNLAFHDAPVSVLCPYDTSALDARVLAGVQRTHPVLRTCDRRHRNLLFEDPAAVAAAADHPLAPAPPTAGEIPITPDLWALRHFVGVRATAAGLSGRRLDDLLLAANEGAANTLVHDAGPGVLRIWEDDGDVVCEIADRGQLTDPLVGRRAPDPEQLGGRGLWLINQLCDLVQLRSGPGGLRLRLHMRLEPAR
jgi:anti-sigma regulatory factor (Ser/Thr protein kinase)